MAETITVKVRPSVAEPAAIRTDMLALGIFSDYRNRNGLYRTIDRRLDGAIEKLFLLGDFKGDVKTSAVLYGTAKTAAKRILLVGLGERKKADIDTVRTAAAEAVNTAVALKAKSIVLAIHQGLADGGSDVAGIGRAIAEGAFYGGYRYDEYIGGSRDKRLSSVEVVIAESTPSLMRQMKGAIEIGAITGRAQNYARTIANRPANVVTPLVLAAEARKLARQARGLDCTILSGRQLRQKKMGGIMAVGQGSKNKPALIVLKYSPAKKTAKTPVIALVGKAITFDSGGISIKPWEGMGDMKYDKSGGVAVLAAMGAIARLKPRAVVYGIIPAAENMPGPSSYRPGDIVTTFSGKTVEIISTDAEGRMLLCDAISYAVKLAAGVIVDIATLTGSCAVALGMERAGIMGNDTELIEQLKTAAGQSGEKLWPLPCDDEYVELMKSKIADLRNVGGKWGGACTAGAFLAQFAGDKKWAHIDIAGVGVFGGATGAAEKNTAVGSRGFGLRTLTQYVMNAAGTSTVRKVRR